MSVLGIRPYVGGFTGSTAPLAEVTMQETATGYIIRRSEATCLRARAPRIAALAGGIVLAVLALALAVAALSHAGPLGWGGAVIFGAGAALLLDYGTSRQNRAFEVDRAARELRELSQCLDGRYRVRSRHPFGKISGLFIDESRGEPVLVLRLGNAERILPVVAGERAALGPLATRIGRDLLEAATATRGCT